MTITTDTPEPPICRNLKIRKHGTSLSITIPAKVIKKLRLKEGDIISIPTIIHYDYHQ